jgi:lysophospholipase L1-like esterase
MLKQRACYLLCVFSLMAVAARAQQAGRAENKWESEIRKFTEADRQTPPPQNAVLFVGSSSIRLWKSLAADFPATKVINRGFGGSEIADSTFFADRIVTPYRPRLVVLYAGDNDLSNGKTPEQVFEDYKQFVRAVHRRLPRARVAFISIKPSPSRAHLMDKARAANTLIQQYAARDRRLAYIDVFTPMLGSDGRPRAELFVEDKLHLNEAGYALWKQVVAPYLK